MLAAARAGDHRWGFAATATAVAHLLHDRLPRRLLSTQPYIIHSLLKRRLKGMWCIPSSMSCSLQHGGNT
jgi:hypothetical protein